MTVSCGQFCPNHSRVVLAAGVLASLLPGVASVASAAPFEDGGLMGNEAWGNRKAHPAVVNAAVPACAPEDGLSLRGEWEFTIREKCIPRRNMFWWHRMYAAEDWQKFGNGRVPSNTVTRIKVPGCWEAQGVGWPAMSRPWAPDDCSPRWIRHRFDGEGWYRKTVRIPETWRGKRIWLKIGGVAPVGWFWVNDAQVAWVDSYCGTYKYEITDLVKPGGDAKFVIQVDNLYPSRQGMMMGSHHWSGPYRDIELEATPTACFIDDAWARGNFDNRTAEVKVKVEGRREVKVKGEGEQSDVSLCLRATVEGETREIAIHSSPSPSDFTLEVPLRNFRPWSPEHPNLYTASVELVSAEGRVLQRRQERFGVRKLEVRGKEFYLNGRPFFLRGFGDDSVYPLEGISPADTDVHRAHLATARAAGFNYTRLHTHCEVPEYFDAADELGVLIEAELPYYGDTPCDRGSFDPVREARELWTHFRRHPSFAIYSGGNEGSFGAALSERLYRMIKKADPDRLSIRQDNPNIGRGNTSADSDFLGGPQTVWKRGSYNPDLPFVCHEYMNLSIKSDYRDEALYRGAWMAPITAENRRETLTAAGLDMDWGARLQDAQNAFQRIFQKQGIETARADPYCDGFCFWTIVDCVVAQKDTYSAQGLFNPFWQPKRRGYAPSDVAVFNSPVCLVAVFPSDRRVFTSGDQLAVRAVLSNYGEADVPAAPLAWRLVERGGRELAHGETPAVAVPVGPARECATVELSVPAVARPLCASLVLSLPTSSGKAENSWNVWLFPKRARSWRTDVVYAEYGSSEAEDAFARGGKVVAVRTSRGKPNASLGWWWMENQVGTALKDHPMLGDLPHEGFLSPLLADIIKDDALKLPLRDVRNEDLVMVGEGGEAFYAYLFVKRNAAGGVMAVATGLDLSDERPEAAAILDGMARFVAELTD